MAKKPKTINYYQKKLKQLNREKDILIRNLAYMVESNSDAELIERMDEYKKLLK
tara:strand:+ start:529 stop:690 length:162 start_codon:yes stop_codon:yes gene_type:complete